jgi:type I restriction enzyme S subunit
MTLMALGETAKFINGAAFKPTDWEDSGLPIIRIQNLTGTSKKFNFTNRQVKSDLVVESGDLLVSWSATLDVYRWAGQRGVLNQHIFKVLPNSDIDPDYLFFALKNALAELSSKTHGSTMKHVVRGDFESTRVNVPPLLGQRRIVDILSRADGIVRLRRDAEKKATELIPALFLELFGDPATNPKGLATATVGDVVASVDYGSSTKATEDGCGVPFIRMNNVDYAGNFNLTNLKYAELSPEEIVRFGLREGDILFNRTNSKELVGKTGIWDDAREAVAASYFIRVRVDRNTISPRFFWAFMNSAHMKRVLFDTARGAIGQANINSKELKAFSIFVPPLDLQIEFAERIEQIRSIQSQQSTATAKVQATFDALLARCFGQPTTA